MKKAQSMAVLFDKITQFYLFFGLKFKKNLYAMDSQIHSLKNQSINCAKIGTGRKLHSLSLKI